MFSKTEYNINSENNLLIVTLNGITKQITLTPGQYVIGSNVSGSNNYISNGTPPKFGFIAELYNSLNNAFVGGGFSVFLATVPPNIPGGTGNNASVLNRIVITHDDNFSIDFVNSIYTSGSPFRVMGFNKQLVSSATNSVVIYVADHGLKIQGNKLLHIDSKESTQVPFFVWFGDKVPSVYKITGRETLQTQTTYIYPLIMKYMGLEAPSVYKNQENKYLNLKMESINYSQLPE
jgi:hypothetical protein